MATVLRPPVVTRTWPRDPLGVAVNSQGQVWQNGLLNLLRGKDTFFGTPGMGPDFDWPNPRGYVPSVALKTWLDPTKQWLFGKDQFFTSPGRGPTYDYPNPRGYVPPIALRTHADPLKLVLLGKDQFFGAAG